MIITSTLAREGVDTYGTFNAHNQRIAVNKHGMFMCTVFRTRSRMNDKSAPSVWALSRSVDEGATWTHTDFTVDADIRPPSVHAFEDHLLIVQPGARDMLLVYELHPGSDFQTPENKIEIWNGFAGKFSSVVDERRGNLYLMTYHGAPVHNANFWVLPLKEGGQLKYPGVVKGASAFNLRPLENIGVKLVSNVEVKPKANSTALSSHQYLQYMQFAKDAVNGDIVVSWTNVAYYVFSDYPAEEQSKYSSTGTILIPGEKDRLENLQRVVLEPNMPVDSRALCGHDRAEVNCVPPAATKVPSLGLEKIGIMAGIGLTGILLVGVGVKKNEEGKRKVVLAFLGVAFLGVVSFLGLSEFQIVATRREVILGLESSGELAGPTMVTGLEEDDMSLWLATTAVTSQYYHYFLYSSSYVNNQRYVRINKATRQRETKMSAGAQRSASGVAGGVEFLDAAGAKHKMVLFAKSWVYKDNIYLLGNSFTQQMCVVSRDQGDTWSVYVADVFPSATATGKYLPPYASSGFQGVHDGHVIFAATFVKKMEGTKEDSSDIYFTKMRLE